MRGREGVQRAGDDVVARRCTGAGDGVPVDDRDRPSTGEARGRQSTANRSVSFALRVAATAPTTPRRRPPAGPAGVRVWWLAAAIVAVAVLSLLIADQTTYDPTAWLIWGREIVHADLSTSAGPSWKPLPVLFTTAGAPFGDDVQQWLWLVVARAGALGALVMAYRLAWRLAGPVAGVDRGGGRWLMASAFATWMFRGDSEGLLVLLALGAIEMHLQGRRRFAFALIALATLLRPELALFAVGYGLYLLATTPPGTARNRLFVAAGGAGVVVVAAWLVPEEIGSGNLFRAASRALEPVSGSPGDRVAPVRGDVHERRLDPAVAAVRDGGRAGRHHRARARAGSDGPSGARARRHRDGAHGHRRGDGRRGLHRQHPLPHAAGRPHVRARRRRRRAPRADRRDRLGGRRGTAAIVAGALVAAPFVVDVAVRTADQVRGGQRESRLYSQLDAAIARAGGAAAIRRCGSVSTGYGFDTQVVARALGLHEFQVRVRGARAPGTLRAAPEPPAPGGPPLPARHARRRLAHRVDLRHVDARRVAPPGVAG